MGTNEKNMTTGSPGKLLMQITESNLTVWFGVSIAMVVLGIVLMAIEYFKKDN